MSQHLDGPRSWRFPTAFWTANIIELFERGAYYCQFIILAPFLTDVAGYSDIETGYIGAAFAALLYLMPFFTGAFADRVGFRRALSLAFALLTIGYAGLWLRPQRGFVLLSLMCIVLGGAIVKPVISGTVARSSDEAHRARAFSLFYMMVNLGGVIGKALAHRVRQGTGLADVPLYSAVVAAIGLVTVVLFYRPKRSETQDGAAKPFGEQARQFLADLTVVLRSGRLMALVLITSGFWLLQGQLYASMPKYVLRLIGPQANPEWIANVNPATVVLLVVPITYLSKRMPSIASIGLAMAIIPVSALLMATMPQWLGSVHGMHPVTVAMILGISLQGLSECFLSPRYLEYASRQAPPDKEGVFMGYAHLNSFLAWMFGYVLSGYLLDAYCPNPSTLSAADKAAYDLALAGGGALPARYAHAHYLWYVFAGIGAASFVLLLAFQALSRVTARRAAAARTAGQLAAA